MLSFSHDADAGTLYCYFTDLEAGQVTGETETTATLLLDDAGQIIGFWLDIDETTHAMVHHGPASTCTLARLLPGPESQPWSLLVTAIPFPELPSDSSPQLDAMCAQIGATQTIALDDPAMLDIDASRQLVGVELFLPSTLAHGESSPFAHLAPYMVSADDPPPPIPPPVSVTPSQSDQTTEQLAHVGVVAIVGRPNVGKSTLLNALLGQKVAIVSPRPQTTRVPVRGILTRPDAQIVFIDTPGIHTPRHKLGEFMVKLAKRAIPAADIVCCMVDISKPPGDLDYRIVEQVRHAHGPRFLLLNKVDLRPKGGTHLEAYRDMAEWDMELAISASRGIGLETLLDELRCRLPPGERLYPADQLADQSERTLAAELVREQVLLFTNQEVPHSVAVEVEEWQEKEEATYVRMTILVERESQKGILIGAGGAMLKRIGTAARREIEQMFGGRPMYLDLWVKAHPNWRDNSTSLGWLGYRLKDW